MRTRMPSLKAMSTSASRENLLTHAALVQAALALRAEDG